MAGAGLLHGPADRLERLPTALGQDRSAPAFARHPGRHLRAGPQATIRRGLTQTILELLQQVGPQNGGACPVPASQIAQSLRTLGVVARQQTVPPNAGQRTPWPRPRQSRGLWPEARSSEGAVPRSRRCRTGTAAPELKYSDDPPHAPWFASATPGASVYPQPQPPRIPADPFSRRPYDWA
jgi:hypothetical protein